MSDWIAIFAQSGLGGLYIGVEKSSVEPEYVQCCDPECECGDGGGSQAPTTFYRMLPSIGEEEVLNALEQGHLTGEIDAKYKVHQQYRWGTGQGLSYLMKHDKDGVQYHPGRGLVAIRERWAGKAHKPRMTRAELDAAEEADYQEWKEDKARDQKDEHDILTHCDREAQAEIDAANDVS